MEKIYILKNYDKVLEDLTQIIAEATKDIIQFTTYIYLHIDNDIGTVYTLTEFDILTDYDKQSILLEKLNYTGENLFTMYEPYPEYYAAAANMNWDDLVKTIKEYYGIEEKEFKHFYP